MVGYGRWQLAGGLAVLAAGLTGCAELVPSSGAINPQNGTVTMFIEDSPTTPTGSTTTGSSAFSDVASLGADFSGVALSGSGGNTSVLNSVQSVELRHLDLAPTLMSVAPNMPDNTFTTLTLTLANPSLIVMNSQGQATQLSSTTTPSVQLAQSKLTLPVSVTVPTKGQVGIALRFDLQNSISIDSSGNYVISPVVGANVIGSSPPDDQLIDATGTITAVSSSPQQEITFQFAKTNQTALVVADSTTQWSSKIGQFSNLQVGENIFVNAQFQPDGSYVARFVGVAANPTLRFEGVLLALSPDSSGNTILTLVVQN